MLNPHIYIYWHINIIKVPSKQKLKYATCCDDDDSRTER